MKAATEYDSWEALVEGESNGWVATAILRERAPRGTLFTMTLGPYSTKREAVNARQRIRSSHRRKVRNGEGVGSDIVAVCVKPAWKDVSA